MTKETKAKKCIDCIHMNACGAWSSGSLINTRADSCMMHETVKESNAYYLGLCDGAKDDWIPVTEAMPEEHKDYLCGEGYMVSDFVLVTRYDCGVRGVSIAYTVNGKFSGVIPVIAWRPLPEPYEEADNDSEHRF